MLAALLFATLVSRDQGMNPPPRARLTLPRTSFVVGEEIRPRFVVHNDAKSVLTLWRPGFSFNHRLILKDGEGREVKRTELGERYEKTFAPAGPRRKNVPIEVGPGASYEENPPDPLNLLFDLSRPGRYTIQIIYEEATLPWVGRIASEPVSFSVAAR